MVVETLPAGQTVRVEHVGAYETLPAAYATRTTESSYRARIGRLCRSKPSAIGASRVAASASSMATMTANGLRGRCLRVRKALTAYASVASQTSW